uniref:Uncharacterized protein n=1 Tax=Podoviridae sp. ct8Lf7 TaxID=2827723 RepID=A0A8S5S0Q4_9CAUD|nr:MAG TPA: hypothetical protein [Podoviridae sp. ct8Lf7]
MLIKSYQSSSSIKSSVVVFLDVGEKTSFEPCKSFLAISYPLV